VDEGGCEECSLGGWCIKESVIGGGDEPGREWCAVERKPEYLKRGGYYLGEESVCYWEACVIDCGGEEAVGC